MRSSRKEKKRFGRQKKNLASNHHGFMMVVMVKTDLGGTNSG